MHNLQSGSIAVAAGQTPASVQNKAEEIMALEPAKLIEMLGDPETPVFAKAKACQRLAVIGTKNAVPVLAALLTDRQLSHYARYGLEPIPDPSVDDVLRDALKKLKGMLLAGVINSIGYRKDAKSVDALAKHLNDTDAQVAQAAAASLGRISGPQAAEKLQKALGRAKASVRQAIAVAAFMCAEGLVAQGNPKQALTLYDALRRAAVPEYMRAAATRRANLARNKEPGARN